MSMQRVAQTTFQNQPTVAEPIPEITIRRDWRTGRWVFAGLGSHIVTTPFDDTRDGLEVADWIHAAARGPVVVVIDFA